MIYPYPGNSPSLIADFHREQSGNHYLILFYKNCSRYCTKAQEIKAALGAAKFTQSSKDLVSWFEELWAKYSKEEVSEGRADTSFASEALTEDGCGLGTAEAPLAPTDPNYQTKMVV